MADEPRGPTEPLERRVQLLESAVRALASEIDQLRAKRPSAPPSDAPVGAPSGPPSDRPSVPSLEPQSAPLIPSRWLPAQLDFESLIGRYGTLVLAVVSALAAVGLFLNWAIEKGWLGPPQRIGLGLLTAATLGVAGIRLRRRERSFGASLLGLALAVVQVCAWGAGPALALVPTWVAFLLASLVSIALAVFAHAEDDEPLWAVGFSGAAIAPFVTSSGKEQLVLLAGYGVFVLAASGYAMGARRWIIAGRLFLLAAASYTTTLALGSELKFGPLLAMGFPLAVAVAAVVPWIDGWRRRERLRALGVLAALSALRSGFGVNLPFESATIALLIAGAGIVWLLLVDRTHAVAEVTTTNQRRLYEGDWLDAAVVPLGFILAAMIAWDATVRESGFGMAAAAVIVLVSVMRYPQGSLRDAAVFAVVMSALVSVMLILKGRDREITATVALLAAACFAANLAWRSAAWTTLGMIGLAWTALAAAIRLTARESYQYMPFATRESVVAAVVLVSILAAWRFSRRDAKLEVILKGGAIGWAFVWVHQEIAFAFNETAATLLRVTYYAATSVAAVGIGRARQVALLRHVGLGLAVLAAGTALYSARHLGHIGARIGADLVAAVFLLAIAYWYRRPGGLKPRNPFPETAGPPSIV